VAQQTFPPGRSPDDGDGAGVEEGDVCPASCPRASWAASSLSALQSPRRSSCEGPPSCNSALWPPFDDRGHVPDDLRRSSERSPRQEPESWESIIEVSSGRSPPTQRCSCPGRKQQQDISLHSDGTGKDELPLPATGETDRSRVNNLAGTEVAWQCSPPRAADGAWTHVDGLLTVCCLSLRESTADQVLGLLHAAYGACTERWKRVGGQIAQRSEASRARRTARGVGHGSLTTLF
jgi:hypothetical protein